MISPIAIHAANDLNLHAVTQILLFYFHVTFGG
jgi:hypothetical protein